MSMKLWGALSLGALLAGLSLGQALADDAIVDTTAPDATDDGGPYVAAQYLREFPDHTRQSAEGNGYELTFGLPLNMIPVPGIANWLPDTALETSFHDLVRKRDIDGGKDYQQALMFNLNHNFGLFGWNGDFTSKYLPRFSPFGILGMGAIREDASGSASYHFGADAGLGLLFPLPWYGISVRTSAVAQLEANHETVPGQHSLLDYQLTVGIQIPLGPLFRRVHAAATRSDCGVAVVSLSGTRSDCVVDSDHDGVPDTEDQCPGTPEGVKVDAKGCPIGNELDSDGDGVPDSQDSCPNTEKGMKVDANGCAVDQVLVLPEVQFKTNSAKLTENSKVILADAARGLNGQKNLNVEISGYTDGSGKSTYNTELSAQRAESVRQYLISKGVDASRMVAKGYGSADPKADNSSAEGRAQNRRVELKVTNQ